MLNTQPPKASRPLIAVVDDDESFLRSLGRLLRSVGYAVETFSSGRAFLSSLPISIPACVVLDIQMPDMNGFEVQERLAALGLCLPVILVTAHDTPQFRQRAHRPDTAGLLTKPFEGTSLLEVVQRTLTLYAT